MNENDIIQELDQEFLPEYNLTRAELKSYFEKVQNPHDWKLNIDSECDKRDVQHIHNAIVFFTGSVPYFEDASKDKYRVRAAGYYIAMGEE